MPSSFASAVDALGWMQFERVCDELLRLEGVEPEWAGHADVGRLATVGDAVGAVVRAATDVVDRILRDL